MADEQIISLCSWKGCNKPASHHYRWEWGEEGNVCAACVQLVNQTAANLSRAVQFKTLDTNAEAPVTRSERTLLIAAKLSAEAELAEVQQRGHALYNQNVELTQQVQTHVMRAREHETLTESQNEQIEELTEKLDARERELAEVSAERQRLQTLVQFASAPTEADTSRVGSERGLLPQR